MLQLVETTIFYALLGFAVCSLALDWRLRPIKSQMARIATMVETIIARLDRTDRKVDGLVALGGVAPPETPSNGASRKARRRASNQNGVKQ